MGDRVMAALQVQPGTTIDPAEFADFLRAQSDLGPKWVPSFIQIVEDFPMTPSNKVIKRELVLRRWHDVERYDDVQLWWRPTKGIAFTQFTRVEATELRAKFAANNRGALLD
jgi:fatty-acyl-CoA synthase